MSSKLVSREPADTGTPMVWQQVGTASGSQGSSFSGGGANGGPAAPGLLPQMQARLAASEAELQQKLREAREAGRREGEAAGRQAAYAEVQPVVERLSAAIQQIAELRPKLRLQAEADMVRLAVAIARRIVNRELNTDTEAITGLIRVGLEKLRLQEVTRVRMHPEYQAVIKELLARSGSAAHVEVSGDATLERGAAIFETSRGDLDMSVETQLREIERGLTDRLRSQGQ